MSSYLFLIFIDIHTIAAIKTTENYADLAEGFKDIFTAINAHINNPIITINSVQYTLEFFLCADYKVCLIFAKINITNSSPHT